MTDAATDGTPVEVTGVACEFCGAAHCCSCYAEPFCPACLEATRPPASVSGEGEAMREAMIDVVRRAIKQEVTNAKSRTAILIEAGDALMAIRALPAPQASSDAGNDDLILLLDAELGRQARDTDNMPYVGELHADDTITLDGTFDLRALAAALSRAKCQL